MRRALAGRVAIHAEAGVGPQPRLGAPDAPASGMESMTRDDVESTSGGTTNGTCNDPVNSGDRMRPCRAGRGGGGRDDGDGAGAQGARRASTTVLCGTTALSAIMPHSPTSAQSLTTAFMPTTALSPSRVTLCTTQPCP